MSFAGTLPVLVSVSLAVVVRPAGPLKLSVPVDSWMVPCAPAPDSVTVEVESTALVTVSRALMARLAGFEPVEVGLKATVNEHVPPAARLMPLQVDEGGGQALRGLLRLRDLTLDVDDLWERETHGRVQVHRPHGFAGVPSVAHLGATPEPIAQRARQEH